MSADTNDLLNLALEIEGLLVLVQQRAEATPARVYALLAAKSSALAAGLALDEPAPAAIPEPEPIPVAMPEPEPIPEPQLEPESEPISAPEPVYEPVHILEDIHIPEAINLPEPQHHETIAGRHISMTLNDKFRMRRELFNDSPEEYADAIAAIEQMTDRGEIIEYVASDLCLNPEDDIVAEFINLVSPAD